MIALIASVLLAASIAPVAERVNIVLVHGAFADGSSWHKVASRLEAMGMRAVAVQLPETSLQDDVAATKRMIAAVKGPVVLVGHSYGGIVITAAADGEPSVRSLVYVAAIVPDVGESAGELLANYPAPGGAHIQPQTGDYLWLNPAEFYQSFCHDITEAEANRLIVAQKPIHKATLGEKLTSAAWRRLPSWFVLTTQDRMVSPELQKFEAKRMASTVVEVASSHVPFLSKPGAVVKAIVAAAGAKLEH